MIRKTFVERVRAKSGLASRAQVDSVVSAFIKTLEEVLMEGENVNFTHFGSFKVRRRAARAGRNPRTGEKINIPVCKTIIFTPCPRLKEAVQAVENC